MDAYPRLYYLVQDSQKYKFVIWGCDAKARKLFRTLRLLDIKPLYCVVADGLRNQLDDDICVKSVYDLAYEDLEWIKVLVFQKTSFILNLLEEVGVDIRRNVQDIHMYREPKFMDTRYQLDVSMGYIKPTAYKRTKGLTLYGDETASIKIVTLGGSTTDDVTYDCCSWSEYLYKYAIASGKSVCVLCGGVAGYNIYQELNFLLRDILPLQPDLVIDYSGANQCGNVVDDRHPNINYYQRLLFEHMKSLQSSEFHIGDLDVNVNYGHEWQESLYENYKRILKIMYAACYANNIYFVSYFQPLLVDKIGKLNKREKELYLNSASMSMEKAMHETRRRDFVRDYCDDCEKLPFQTGLINIFDEEDVYLDYAHVNERGNEIIAKHIWYDICKKSLI